MNTLNAVDAPALSKNESRWSEFRIFSDCAPETYMEAAHFIGNVKLHVRNVHSEWFDAWKILNQAHADINKEIISGNEFEEAA